VNSHWKIGTIASELNVHPDAVRNAIESERFNRTQPLRASVLFQSSLQVEPHLHQYNVTGDGKKFIFGSVPRLN
jgi:hypothetical protein